MNIIDEPCYGYGDNLVFNLSVREGPAGVRVE
jgi:hypothetical protein